MRRISEFIAMISPICINDFTDCVPNTRLLLHATLIKAISTSGTDLNFAGSDVTVNSLPVYRKNGTESNVLISVVADLLKGTLRCEMFRDNAGSFSSLS